eukprot:TRINITY_DN4555_c0_g2_i1.p1 TRINITY_DN4555_c0_g2~~TRINITY_DN4555_c0_g2_i1.p1  ORF type:complete len:798 (-),score=264.64 TRINITY_DN4555_c0_g2_i1:118-2511(-)
MMSLIKKMQGKKEVQEDTTIPTNESETIADDLESLKKERERLISVINQKLGRAKKKKRKTALPNGSSENESDANKSIDEIPSTGTASVIGSVGSIGSLKPNKPAGKDGKFEVDVDVVLNLEVAKDEKEVERDKTPTRNKPPIPPLHFPQSPQSLSPPVSLTQQFLGQQERWSKTSKTNTSILPNPTPIADITTLTKLNTNINSITSNNNTHNNDISKGPVEVENFEQEMSTKSVNLEDLNSKQRKVKTEDTSKTIASFVRKKKVGFRLDDQHTEKHNTNQKSNINEPLNNSNNTNTNNNNNNSNRTFETPNNTKIQPSIEDFTPETSTYSINSSNNNESLHMSDLNDDIMDESETTRSLQGKIRVEKHRYAILLEKFNLIQEQQKETEEKAKEAEAKSTEQIRLLCTKIEELAERCMKLEVDLKEAKESSESEKNRADTLEQNTSVLRELVVNGQALIQSGRKRSYAEQKLWEKLATPEVLAASQPPRSFPVQMGASEYSRSTNASSLELEKTTNQLRKSQSEVKQLTARIVRLEEDNRDLLDRSRATIQEARASESRQEVQLAGAVRRIQWLLEQQKKLTENLKGKDEYIAKVESKLLEQSKQLKKVTTTNTKPEQSSTNSKSTSFLTSPHLSSKPTTHSHTNIYSNSNNNSHTHSHVEDDAVRTLSIDLAMLEARSVVEREEKELKKSKAKTPINNNPPPVIQRRHSFVATNTSPLVKNPNPKTPQKNTQQRPHSQQSHTHTQQQYQVPPNTQHQDPPEFSIQEIEGFTQNITHNEHQQRTYEENEEWLKNYIEG